MEQSVRASYPAVYFFKMVEKLWKSDLANKKGRNPEKGEIQSWGELGPRDDGQEGENTVRMMSTEYWAHCFPSTSTIPSQG